VDKERRRSQRVPILVEVNYEGAGIRGQTRISDIGIYGVFVDTLSPLPAGAELSLSFTLPDGHVVEAVGIVVHSQPRIGMGINFTSAKEVDLEHIRRCIASDISNPNR
jgi:PilZ domain-containing protein